MANKLSEQRKQQVLALGRISGGVPEGANEGPALQTSVGVDEGAAEGLILGNADGDFEGDVEGAREGFVL